MASALTWARRVAAWRASGRSSEAFCRGKPYTAGGLRHWAYQLRRKDETADVPVVRIGRVVRRGSPAVEPPRSEVATREAATIVVECGGAQVAVRAGFDRATLAAVLEVLRGRGAGR